MRGCKRENDLTRSDDHGACPSTTRRELRDDSTDFALILPILLPDFFLHLDRDSLVTILVITRDIFVPQARTNVPNSDTEINNVFKRNLRIKFEPNYLNYLYELHREKKI